MPLPKSHVDYWQEKFRRNVERDAEKTKELEDSGWKVVVIWECRLKKEPEEVSSELKGILDVLYGRLS
jgi:DNA mismatch endonuclease (patch repair protein)